MTGVSYGSWEKLEIFVRSIYFILVVIIIIIVEKVYLGH